MSQNWRRLAFQDLFVMPWIHFMHVYVHRRDFKEPNNYLSLEEEYKETIFCRIIYFKVYNF